MFRLPVAAFPVWALLVMPALAPGAGEGAEDGGEARAAARREARERYDLRVDAEGWGSGSPEDVAAVLRSACDEIAVMLTGKLPEPIRVKRDAAGPIVHFQRNLRGEVVMLLSAGDRFWAQYAYQAAHEFCHIVCGFREGERSNLWFEEALCEMASIHAVKGMAETWRTHPPYPNWKDFAKPLAEYAAEVEGKFVPAGDESLAAYYGENAEALAANPTDRARNGRVAVALLPLFEEKPEGWRALPFLNANGAEGKRTFREYLRDWRRSCPEAQKGFVEEVERRFFGEPEGAQERGRAGRYSADSGTSRPPDFSRTFRMNFWSGSERRCGRWRPTSTSIALIPRALRAGFASWLAAHAAWQSLRAGLADDPLDYRWCAYAAAAGGDEAARKGMERVVFGPEDVRRKGTRCPGWAKVVAEYRLLVYGAGEEMAGGAGPDGVGKGKRGFSREEIKQVWARGGKLSLAAALRGRVRYFTDGVALGSSAFVNRFFEQKRGHFGPRRETGARKMRGAEWRNLRCLRDLRVIAVG